MYRYYGVDDKNYQILFHLIDENEKIIDKLYGKEKLSKEEMSELNRIFEKNDFQIDENLAEISPVEEFKENESEDINNLIKENKSLRLAFSHNYVMHSDLGNLIDIIKQIGNRQEKLIETLKKIYEQKLNLIVR